MSTKGPPFSLFDISQQRMLKNPKGSFFLIFRHYETAIKISHFLFFFLEIFIKDSKESPFNFWIFATEWMLKNLKGSPLSQFPALWHSSKGIIFMLKLGFLRSGTLYPIFVVLKDRCFSMRLF